jgi:hypothetical protein
MRGVAAVLAAVSVVCGAALLPDEAAGARSRAPQRSCDSFARECRTLCRINDYGTNCIRHCYNTLAVCRRTGIWHHWYGRKARARR